MNKDPRQWVRRLGLILISFLAPLSAAYSAPYIKPDLAAFYQHQKSGADFSNPPWNIPANAPDPPPSPLAPSYDLTRNWWEDQGGWCGTTAWINSFYYWDRNGYPGLFDHSSLGTNHQGRTWLERFVYANEDLAIRAGGGSSAGCASFPRSGANLAPLGVIPDYLSAYGHGTNSLVYSEYFWDTTANQVKQRTPTGDVAASFTNMFDLYYTELLRSEDVVVVMQGLSTNWWWGQGTNLTLGNFHVVTGAGVESNKTQNTLWFADPDRGRGGTNGWGYPYLNSDSVPVGTNFYTLATLMADGRTFATGPYAGAFISEIHTVSPIPEPGVLVLVVIGIISLLACGRPSRKLNGRAAVASPDPAPLPTGAGQNIAWRGPSG
jgi:hypothetical protein